jgi:hypothetical protein
MFEAFLYCRFIPKITKCVIWKIVHVRLNFFLNSLSQLRQINFDVLWIQVHRPIII